MPRHLAILLNYNHLHLASTVCLRKISLMYDLYYWTTPNGHKITIFLEEAGLDYRLHGVNISQGEQFTAEFLAISPNNKIPALVDHAPAEGNTPLSIFESGAILDYLAAKTGKFAGSGLHQQTLVSQWLFWQMGGFGPMLGQNHHFTQYAPEKIPYAINRYQKETERLYGVLDKQLTGKEFVADEYSIADMAIYPWVVPHTRQNIDLSEFPNVNRWFQSIRKRAAVVAAYEKGAKLNNQPTVMDDKAKAVLFGQGKEVLTPRP